MSKMTNSQEEHLQRLKDEFVKRVDAKYRAGAREHGGDLQEVGILTLLEYAMEEVEDMWVYLFTLYEKAIHLED